MMLIDPPKESWYGFGREEAGFIFLVCVLDIPLKSPMKHKGLVHIFKGNSMPFCVCMCAILHKHLY